jgi:autotransporter passenger strand-loop-strand repeat protein
MTTFTAPPDQTGLVLNFGDILDVNSGGTATDTTINFLGTVNVNGGTATDTTITRSGRLFVDHGGMANDTIIKGGMEDVGRSGTANDTIIHDGRLFDHGIANDTIIDRFGIEHVEGVSNNTTINGGVESVDAFGLANNVIFAGSKSVLELARPSGLGGTISDWHVGDVIDFLHTSVTSVHEK